MKYIMNFINKSLYFIKHLFLIPLWLLIGLHKRNNKLWIFSSWSGERYSDNSRVFYEWVRNNHPEIECVWVLRKKELIKKLNEMNIMAFHINSKEGKKLLLSAGKVFTVRDDEFSFFRLNGAEIYQLWHGMPLKKIKNDYLDGITKISKARKIYDKIMQIVTPWAVNNYKNRFTCTNAAFFTQFLSSSFNLSDKRILNCGTPRCDALFYKKSEKLLKSLSEKYPGCKFILYMPTFRTSQWNGKYFNPFDVKYGFEFIELEKILEDKNYIFLYKPHFYDAKFLDSKKTSERFVTITDDDIDELYNFCGQVDILLTDYSSIYFDFMVTRKPVILMPFDYEDYLKTSRNHYFDYYSNMDGVMAKDWKETISILRDEKFRPVSEEKILQFAEYVDGNCCQKLYKEIENE
ncbi:CDP-glycerol glycerophosphotransferase [Treponema bryantii]|uniref:CDP-glycerol glycerophosphotransferase n=1 Tax=Treponema bryantii TaxID=163 RepID=A0A1H9G8S5_9SPIR|nr:CDP-glycerol glycerophosphotransferase family protein [Treponema bryantii]SEQ46501.1 CDP-glycerol glycerophosphotransferase [Treponema bryantii]